MFLYALVSVMAQEMSLPPTFVFPVPSSQHNRRVREKDRALAHQQVERTLLGLETGVPLRGGGGGWEHLDTKD